MKMARTIQRNAARNAPARERRERVKPSTSFTDEYKNAGGWPRLPFSHANNGISNNSSKKYGYAKLISIPAS
jgi:hypothetical protein